MASAVFKSFRVLTLVSGEGSYLTIAVKAPSLCPVSLPLLLPALPWMVLEPMGERRLDENPHPPILPPPTPSRP